MQNLNQFCIRKKPKWAKQWPEMNRYEKALYGIYSPSRTAVEKLLRWIGCDLRRGVIGNALIDFLINWRFRLGFA